jgi:hypothetical protein
LAVSAGQQAVAANTQSQQAIAQTKQLEESLKKTDALVTYTNELGRAAKRAASASEVANKQATSLFRLQNRPWVGINGDVVLDDLSTANAIFRLKLSYKA